VTSYFIILNDHKELHPDIGCDCIPDCYSR